MIEKITDFNELSDFQVVNLYTVRIKSLAKTYGFDYSFVSFYRQSVNGVCTAVFSILDSDITLAVDTETADIEELFEFFVFRGFSSLLCADDFVLNCDYECGTIMKSSQKVLTEAEYNIRELKDFNELSDLYNFIGYSGSFDLWYADVRRRISKSTVTVYAIYEQNKIVSSALLSSVFDKNAVLTGVRTEPSFRNKGYAGALVSKLCGAVNGAVFLMRENDKNENFYRRLGFKNIDKWRIYK